MSDYCPEDLARALDQVGLAAGDTVYCHSNIGLFGSVAGVADRDTLCRLYFDAIMDRIGPSGTLIVPTYTYSFGQRQSFDPDHTESKMGMFAEWVRRHPDSIRSHDPMFSVAVIGNRADRFCTDIPPNSFAQGSTFDRFAKENGTVLCLNHPGCTLLHYVERELGVPYRFDKRFEGEFIHDGRSTIIHWEIFVRYLSDDLLSHDAQPFVAAEKAERRARWTALGRGEVLAIRAADVFETVRDQLCRHPWFLTAAHAAGRSPHMDPTCR